MYDQSTCTSCGADLDIDLKATGFEICEACIGIDGSPISHSQGDPRQLDLDFAGPLADDDNINYGEGK